MKTAEQFIVGEKVTFRLSDNADGEDYTALVKKAKQNLLAIVISNRDKKNLHLDIGDNIYIYSELDGVTYLTSAKVVQNQSFPLIILDTYGDPVALPALDGGPDYSVAEDETPFSPAPAMEIESIDDDHNSGAEDDSVIVENDPMGKEAAQAPIEPSTETATSVSLENGQMETGHDGLSEPGFLANDDVDLDDIDLITLETSDQVSAAEHEGNAGSVKFFGVWITQIEEGTAEKIGEAILSGDMTLPGSIDNNAMDDEISDGAQKGSMEKLLDHVSRIEKTAEKIRKMVTGGSLNARHGGSGAVCVEITAESIRLVSDEPMAVGDYWLVTVDHPWKPSLYFTAVAIVDDCENVNDMSVANLRFSAIHADAASSIANYLDHANDFLEMLKALRFD